MYVTGMRAPPAVKRATQYRTGPCPSLRKLAKAAGGTKLISIHCAVKAILGDPRNGWISHFCFKPAKLTTPWNIFCYLFFSDLSFGKCNPLCSFCEWVTEKCADLKKPSIPGSWKKWWYLRRQMGEGLRPDLAPPQWMNRLICKTSQSPWKCV